MQAQYEHTPPNFPLALATATKKSGDAGHVILLLHNTGLVNNLNLHACILVQTDDKIWSTLGMRPTSQLAGMWDGNRDQCFKYLVDAQTGEPTGVAGWPSHMRDLHPESLPGGATPGTWTHTEGQKIALMAYPSTISSGAYERNPKWNTLGGREFRILVYAEDRVAYPEVICVTPAFRIMSRSTLGKNAGKLSKDLGKNACKLSSEVGARAAIAGAIAGARAANATGGMREGVKLGAKEAAGFSRHYTAISRAWAADFGAQAGRVGTQLLDRAANTTGGWRKSVGEGAVEAVTLSRRYAALSRATAASLGGHASRLSSELADRASNATADARASVAPLVGQARGKLVGAISRLRGQPQNEPPAPPSSGWFF